MSHSQLNVPVSNFAISWRGDQNVNWNGYSKLQSLKAGERYEEQCMSWWKGQKEVQLLWYVACNRPVTIYLSTWRIIPDFSKLLIPRTRRSNYFFKILKILLHKHSTCQNAIVI
jgi:hypothetical protein